MQHLTIEQFRATVEAGGVLSVTLTAQGPAFSVRAETRRGEAILIDTRRKQPRLFVDPRKALKLLREFGIHNAKLNAEDWRPEQAAALHSSRPDSRATMKAANEVVSLMKRQVQEALAEYSAGQAGVEEGEAFFVELQREAAV